jgi:tRNA isopentenyl-2-thiomethyl-A-37 hydroxylase MiaE
VNCPCNDGARFFLSGLEQIDRFILRKQMDRVREMLRHYRQTVEWIDQQAADYESAKATHHTNGVDDSKRVAEDLRHKARNLETVIAAVERFTEEQSGQ